MTLKYFCDRCDANCDSQRSREFKHASIHVDPYPRRKQRPFQDSLDLCPKCYEDFKKFMSKKD